MIYKTEFDECPSTVYQCIYIVTYDGNIIELANYYMEADEEIENNLENANREVGERELGCHEATGKKVIARMGRYGPMVQIGHQDEEESTT